MMLSLCLLWARLINHTQQGSRILVFLVVLFFGLFFTNLIEDPRKLIWITRIMQNWKRKLQNRCLESLSVNQHWGHLLSCQTRQQFLSITSSPCSKQHFCSFRAECPSLLTPVTDLRVAGSLWKKLSTSQNERFTYTTYVEWIYSTHV